MHACVRNILLLMVVLVSAVSSEAQSARPRTAETPTPITGWRMQDATRLPQDGTTVSTCAFHDQDWYPATVPGTILTTLVANHVYPEPTYGENDRPEIIPDSLARTPFWYRTVVPIPRDFTGRQIWLTFEGINYSAEIWVEGHQAGTMRGAFRRGRFNIAPFVRPGTSAAVAVLIKPQPHPGVPHEHTLRAGLGQNGGITALDGPTFLSTIGWDWIPAQRDRDSGLWREVTLSATGPVVLRDPVVTTDLDVPGFRTAGITVQATLENVTDQPQDATFNGTLEGIHFGRTVHLAPHASQSVAFSPRDTPMLLLEHPRLWWPNGYGPQNLYTARLSVAAGHTVSDTQEVTFGVRKLSYTVASTDNLAFVVNGVPIFVRGGDWGLDDAMKRIPRERMDAQIRMHAMANLNMIRNWVGQSTSEQFYSLCDHYGLLVWDEFFQPNPSDGPDPEDLDTYLANVKDKILRFRNHPSIALWCARNEGNPPATIDTALRSMLAELDLTRLYQANSSDGRGVRSHGPYHWRPPLEFYTVAEGLKTETGSVSIPTIESIQGMMPQKDWETITDDWAEHDLARGASGGDVYPGELAARYGAIVNLADFVRKAQLANYEAFRAMIEGRNAVMFHPTTGVLTWMSHPAQPSFVWQLYHYDLEPNAALFAFQHASEQVHLQFSELTSEIQVINNKPEPLRGATASVAIYNLDGTLAGRQTMPVTAAASDVTAAGQVAFHEPLSSVHFLVLELHDATGTMLSRNVYWHTLPEGNDSFKTLNSMPTVTLTPQITRTDQAGTTTIHVTLHNPSTNIALMTHVQLHRATTGDRVLPAFYSDNYISLAGGETQKLSIELSTESLHGEPALVLVDGFNILVDPVQTPTASVALNVNAQVAHWPATGLPFQTIGLR